MVSPVSTNLAGFLIFLLVAGSLTLTIVLPLTIQHNGPPMAEPSLGGSPSEEYHYIHSACPMKTDWALASNERQISNQYMAQSGDLPDIRHLGTYAWAWGQFIDHDIVRSDPLESSQEFIIKMDPYDVDLKMKRTRDFSATGDRKCVNHITPFIDATTVYGDYLNAERLAKIRIGQHSCKLKTSTGNLPPLNDAGTEFYCGDVRCTEHAVLTTLHTLFLREHNRQCDALKAQRFTQDWNEDQRFWKARQLTIAKIQRITYSEWLPLLFGSQHFLLSSVPPKRADAAIVSEFSVAAYRFGHSMVNQDIGKFSLPEMFFNVPFTQQNGIDSIVEEALKSSAQRCDIKIMDGLRNFLFSAGPNQIGEDLATRNLFRGRDMELGTYEQIAHCYNPLQTLQTTPPVDDAVPLLLNEPIVGGSSLPPTIARIVAEQFRRLKYRDPNFYEFNWEKIGREFQKEIESTTLKSVIEANSGVKISGESAFLLA